MQRISTQHTSSSPHTTGAAKSLALVGIAATLALLLSACGEPAKSGMGSSGGTGSSTSSPAPMDGTSAAKP